jgi:prophage DNA circulation protein
MKYQPMLDGFDLELLSGIDTTVEKALVEYEIPFATGGLLDDMGAKARRFSFKTLWRGDRYEQHEYFAEHCLLDQVNRFVHPELGGVAGRVKSVTVTHDDRRRCAEIAVEFLAAANPDVQPAYDPPLVALLEDGLGDVMEALSALMGGELAAAGLDPSAAVDASGPLAGQVRAPKWAARMYLAKLAKGLNDLKAAYDTVTNAVDSAVAMVNFAATLPGTVIAAVAAAVERAAMAAQTVGNAPMLFASSLRAAVNRLRAAVPLLGGSILMAGASIAALFIGKQYADDESGKTVLRRLEGTPRWRLDGTPLTPAPAPQVLTANEVEESLSLVREMLQDGISAARSAGDSKTASALARQAEQLSRYVNTVKMERDRLVAVEVEADTPLHLICLRHGLPYAYADRIATINNFNNPTFCAGGVRLYARHS